jgi:hypothetical protein
MVSQEVSDVPQEDETGDAAESRISIGEVPANIAEGRCAQQCIGNGVEQDIRVGVTLKALF